MMRNGTIAAIGAGLLTIGGIANAQAVVVGGGPPQPPPGSGDSVRTTSDYRDAMSAMNERMGAGTRVGHQDEPSAKKPRAVPATAADVKAGAALRDINGAAIGTIVSLDGDQAVVDTGQTKIGVPLIAFGKDKNGLLLGMTADKFNQLVAAAHAKSQPAN